MDAPIYARNHTHTIRLFCMRACVYMLTPTLKTVSHVPRSSPCGGGAASLGLDSSRWEHALVSQVGLQSMEDAELLLRLEQQQLLQHFAGVRTSDKAGDIDVCEGGHQVLAVEAVHDAAVARDGIGKVFDFKRSFEAAGKEAAKRSDERSKRREEDAVDREGIQVDSFPSQCVL